MRKVFNPGGVPLVVGGHAVPAGEWSDVADNASGLADLLATGLLTEPEAEPKASKKETSR